MDEVFEPTYNYPWRVVVREVVTKLNRLYFKAPPPASIVRAHASALEGDASLDTILDAAFLGSSEVLPALESLVKTSTNGNVVVYALDAIGIIGDPKSFPFLQDFYATARERGRMFSLKAIGDLGTPEALAFIRGQPGEDDNLKEIIDLYSY
jgi:HEAT repeat protein